MKTYNKGFQIKNYGRQTFRQKRSLPFGITLKTWFSNPFTFMGIMFIVMGVPFTFIFTPISSFTGPSFSDEDPVARGEIIDSRGTNSSINDVQVYAYTYKYSTPDGQTHEATGYSTGNTHAVGNQLPIYYKADEPEISEAEGLRRSTFGGGFTLFVWIFPIIGTIMFVLSIKKVILQIQILKVGELAEGKFLHQEATNTRINNQTVYKLFFEFTANDGKTYQAIAKTHKTYRLMDEEFEKLVYDPVNPSNAVVLDALPKGIKNYFLHHYSR